MKKREILFSFYVIEIQLTNWLSHFFYYLSLVVTNSHHILTTMNPNHITDRAHMVGTARRVAAGQGLVIDRGVMTDEIIAEREERGRSVETGRIRSVENERTEKGRREIERGRGRSRAYLRSGPAMSSVS